MREWNHPYPEVAVGDTVWFYHGRRLEADPLTPPQTGVVTAVESMGVRLALIPPDQPLLKIIDDVVRFKSDPDAVRLIENDPDQGVWETTPWHIPPSRRPDIMLLLKVFKSEIDQFRGAAEKPAGELDLEAALSGQDDPGKAGVPAGSAK